MRRLQGLPGAPGVVRAPWLRIERLSIPAGGQIEPTAAAAEIERLQRASESAAVELEMIARQVERDGHADEAAIFRAQASMARDPALATMAAERINGAASDAVGAIQAAADAFA